MSVGDVKAPLLDHSADGCKISLLGRIGKRFETKTAMTERQCNFSAGGLGQFISSQT